MAGACVSKAGGFLGSLWAKAHTPSAYKKLEYRIVYGVLEIAVNDESYLGEDTKHRPSKETKKYDGQLNPDSIPIK